ncbi:MAG TPA: LytTR family DNA-binding domain-containing protein [Candidatus Bacteroides merdigallinarum]|uniref:LytTR family DNA-binding domain-containing protein n=1 Tax=Candidatus Bacteroides merdigallinarum TaxID=2838473 RepID=A0A9D2E7Y9_9BACE|nr:LytTR family DNA-binding domain-containing protein [Candidatus Bacteroides merdigallinarum]
MDILILEDEARNANRLMRQLKTIDPTFCLHGPLESIRDAVDFFRQGNAVDLILADIRLADGLSFEALKEAPPAVPVIFTTAYDEYAIRAFKFNSYDYLLKPVEPDELKEALDKVKRRGTMYAPAEVSRLLDVLEQSNCSYRERFLFPYRDGYKVVNVSEVSHFSTESRVVTIHLNNGTSGKLVIPLEELEKQLDPKVFFRANRQYIIHIDSLSFVSNYFGGKLKIHLKGYADTEIVVSKEKAPMFKDWVNQ